MRNSCVILFFLLSISVYTNAQRPPYSTTSKPAIKAFEEGAKYYDARNYSRAIELFQQALSRDANFIEAQVILAEVYAANKDYENAIVNYKKAIGINPTFFPNNYFLLAGIELKTGKYEDALADYEQYKKLVTNLYSEKSALLESGILNCKFALNAIKNPVPFNPVNLGKGINTADAEYYPSFTIDQKRIIFTRRLPDVKYKGSFNEDFYISNLTDTVWGNAVNAGQPLNTILNEGAPSFSADGRVLFFTACDRPEGKGSCDIYLCQLLPNGTWTKPFNLGSPVNTGAWETQPSFSSDGKTLYFIRGDYNSNHQRQQDILFSNFQDDNTWSSPKKLPGNINTNGQEESVFIHPDNQTLFFTSDGHPGMGGLDIFMSRRDTLGKWGDPLNLAYPINTFNDENSLVVSADGKKAYFASDREGGFGDLDLYSFNLYAAVQPISVSFVKAKVTDAETKLPLAAKFEIIDVESGKVIVSNSTDQKRGEFLASLPAGKNYMLNVNKESYLFYSDYFECKETNDRQHAFELNIQLNKLKQGEKVVLKNIFFDVNKFDLKPESNAELNKLVQFLKTNSAIKIQISGHTDNTGDKKSNQVLSENRARAVYDFLVKSGISSAKLTFKGFGDSISLSSNDTEEGRAMNRRTEFTIL